MKAFISFSRNLLFGLLLFAASSVGFAANPPNVIFIMSDDQGSVDAGCYGSKDLQTPAIDGLAKKGVRFTQFYSASPVCSPSRAGMLTGRYPWLVGMPHNAASPPTEQDDQLENLTGPGLASDVANLPKIFKAAGYATAHIGKWHLGSGVGHKPLDQGFDYSFGFMGGCVDNFSHFNYWHGPNRHDLWENNRRVHFPGQFLADLLVQKATGFIQSTQGKPFFMYFALNMPHYPYQGDPKWLKVYEKLPFPRNLYAAFLSTMDERIGFLLKALQEAGLRENTIVIFQSDNGYSIEERAHGGGGSSGPYRGCKFSLFEGGIRLPAIISWPGKLPEGEVRGQMVHSCDWMPTLAELCGVKCDTAGLSGASMVPVIRKADAPTPHEVLVWSVGKQWAVRQGPWKLLHKPEDRSKSPLTLVDGCWFLANVEQDPGEQKNLAGEHPEILERLKQFAPKQ